MKKVSVKGFMGKCPSKHEVRMLLALHFCMYLPHEKYINSIFLRELMQGKKMVSAYLVVIVWHVDRNLLKAIDVP